MTEPKTFMCVFCKYRSQERHFGCPGCGRRYGYGEVRTVKTIQLAQAIVFTAVGGFLILLGAAILVSELRQPYAMAPWWTFTIIFGIGALFIAGGLSSFFGNSWLLGLLLISWPGAVARLLRRAPLPPTTLVYRPLHGSFLRLLEIRIEDSGQIAAQGLSFTQLVHGKELLWQKHSAWLNAWAWSR